MRAVLDVSLVLLQGAVGVVALLSAVVSDFEEGEELIWNLLELAGHEDPAVDRSRRTVKSEIDVRRTRRPCRHGYPPD